VWETTAAGGRQLTFHLCGINNQNFVMRDDETGSWWQQASGEAFLGPLRGNRLRPVVADEVGFAIWRREHPGGRVLRPATDPAWREFSANWEAVTARLPVVSAAPPAVAAVPPRGEASAAFPSGGAAGAASRSGAAAGRSRTVAALPPRALVVGLAIDGVERAYPVDVLRRQAPVMDQLGGTAVVILVGEDGRSVRVFDSRVDGQAVPFFARLEPSAGASRAPAPARRWIDGVTGSEWDFQGRAVAGRWQGRQLRPLGAMKDYWFDWWTYHPRTSIYLG
jgi:Protein of unknown function (DUF3179)